MDQKSLETKLSSLKLSKLAYFDQLGSTNDLVADWARAGIDGLCLAVADEQTKGRGRSGRHWFTPPGAALAFSLLLSQNKGKKLGVSGRSAGLGALAVCQAMEALYSLSPEIKWPNDVLLAGKKVCGILAEAHWSGEDLQALIFGIGINIAPSSVPQPKDLAFPAISLEDALGHPIERMELLKVVLERLLALTDGFQAAELIRAWQSRLAYIKQEVSLTTSAGEYFQGQLLGLDEDGGLRLKLSSDEIAVFQAGELQLRPMDNSAH